MNPNPMSLALLAVVLGLLWNQHVAFQALSAKVDSLADVDRRVAAAEGRFAAHQAAAGARAQAIEQRAGETDRRLAAAESLLAAHQAAAGDRALALEQRAGETDRRLAAAEGRFAAHQAAAGTRFEPLEQRGHEMDRRVAVLEGGFAAHQAAADARFGTLEQRAGKIDRRAAAAEGAADGAAAAWRMSVLARIKKLEARATVNPGAQQHLGAVQAMLNGQRNFAGMDLRNLDMTSLDFAGAKLFGARADCALLLGAGLPGADLQQASFRGANLTGANLSHAVAHDVDLSGATLVNASLASSRMDRGKMVGAHAQRVDLSQAQLHGADARDVNMTGATLDKLVATNTTFVGGTFVGASLKAVTLDGANVVRVDFTDVDFTGAKLGGVVNLAGAKLDNLRGAMLAGTRLTRRVSTSRASTSQCPVCGLQSQKCKLQTSNCKPVPRVTLRAPTWPWQRQNRRAGVPRAPRWSPYRSPETTFLGVSHAPPLGPTSRLSRILTERALWFALARFAVATCMIWLVSIVPCKSKRKSKSCFGRSVGRPVGCTGDPCAPVLALPRPRGGA